MLKELERGVLEAVCLGLSSLAGNISDFTGQAIGTMTGTMSDSKGGLLFTPGHQGHPRAAVGTKSAV